MAVVLEDDDEEELRLKLRLSEVGRAAAAAAAAAAEKGSHLYSWKNGCKSASSSFSFFCMIS